MIDEFLSRLPYHWHWQDNFELRGLIGTYLSYAQDKGWPVEIAELAESLIVLSGGNIYRAIGIIRYSFLKSLYPFQVEAWRVVYYDPADPDAE